MENLFKTRNIILEKKRCKRSVSDGPSLTYIILNSHFL